MLERSLELESEPQADRDNSHSGSTTQRADSGQQSTASAAGGEDGLSAEEEPNAEEGQGQLPQDLQWDKVATAEAREDDYTGIVHVSVSARFREPLTLAACSLPGSKLTAHSYSPTSACIRLEAKFFISLPLAMHSFACARHV